MGLNQRKAASTGGRKTASKRAGASRKSMKGQGFSLKLGAVVKVIKGLTAACLFVTGVYLVQSYNLVEKWGKLIQKPISRVQVEGDFLYLSKVVVQQQVNQFVEKDLLNVNIAKIKAAMELNPWIDSVSISRKWPGVLQVRIAEQQPIARWGDTAFLNMRGDIIPVDSVPGGSQIALNTLPLLKGDDRYAEQVMQQYLTMGKLLVQAELSLEAVMMDNTKSWTLVVDNDTHIILGRELFLEKLQSFVNAKRNHLASRFNDIQYVDLRYHNGFAVGWRQQAATLALASAK